MFLSWLALLFSILGEVTAVDICSDYPKPDPCLPGGEWDPVLNRYIQVDRVASYAIDMPSLV